MANSKTHAAFGVVAGAGAAAYLARNEEPLAFALETLGGITGGLLGAAMPDLLEPALSPLHRGVAHGVAVGSVGVAGALTKGAEALAWARRLEQDLEEELRGEVDANRKALLAIKLALLHLAIGAIVGFLAGYASHLVLDAGTPRSLPLLARGF